VLVTVRCLDAGSLHHSSLARVSIPSRARAALARDLTQRGCTQADMQLFSDERALAHAGAVKVCQRVKDWFAAQLAIKDADMQLRLLVDSLKPTVAG
jgi:hypothetical protein